MPPSPSLDQRLAAAGVDPGCEPLTAWHRLHDVEGPRATVIDLYELVARTRGLAGHELPMKERHSLGHSVMPEVWPGFATTDGSDRGADPIEIVAYNPDWPAQFDRYRQRIQSALGEIAARVEHVGSTAVPGLAAKPTVDIQISVVDLAAEEHYVAGLEQIDLQLRSRDDWHRYFRPFPDRPRDVHVHVCATGSDWERDHLLFRDYLRSHPDACARYAEAKREAAELWSDDRIAYTDAKTAVVLAILDDAETWSAVGRG